MISIGENKASLCKGDFRPAQFYKGDKKIAGYNVEEFEGENGVTLENCYNDKLHNVQIFGNSIQDGTPTPENPIEVQSVGALQTEGEYAGKYKIPVKARGKNLFKYIKGEIANGSIIEELPTGAIVRGNLAPEQFRNSYSRGWVRPGVSSTSGICPVLHTGDIVTISADITLLELRQDDIFTPTIHIFTREANSGHTSDSTSADSITLNETKRIKRTYTIAEKYNGRTFFPVFTINSNTVKIENIQIEYGDTVTDYEPYIEPQTFDIYLDEPLRKVGDYEDYVDFEKGLVVRNIAKKVFNGTEAWQRFSLGHFGYSIVKIDLPSNKVYCSCNYLRGETWDEIARNSSRTDGNYVVGVAKKSDRINVTPSPALPTMEEWKAQLAAWNEEGNPFTVWYVVPPVEEPFNIPELPTFKGTTIIEIDSDVTATISGKYKKLEEEE